MKDDCFAIGKNLDNISDSFFQLYKMDLNKEIGELTKLFQLTISELDQLLIEPTYKVFTIPKKKGGMREITAPNFALRSVQQLLNAYLQKEYPHNLGLDSVFISKKMGVDFTAKSPLVRNAILHIKQPFLASIDIKDFYSSITAQQVFSLFTGPKFNFSEKMALILTRLTTYKGYLPTGAPTSPVISNFILADKDQEILQFLTTKGIVFSRYADDITLSSENPISVDIITQIEEILSPFQINNKKTRFISANRQQKVTGIVVNEKQNVDRKWLKKLRAMLYDYEKNGLMKASFNHFKQGNKEAFFLIRITGYLSFLSQVKGKNDIQFQKYNACFDRLKLNLG
jgi:RNA-directed DNA polymerase